MQDYLRLVEQSPKRSRAAVFAINTFFMDVYLMGFKLSKLSLEWSTEGSRPMVLRAFVEKIRRWKAESERLSGAMQNEGKGLLPCLRDTKTKRVSNSVASSVFDGESEGEYDSEDILGLRSGKGSDTDDGNAKVDDMG